MSTLIKLSLISLFFTSMNILAQEGGNNDKEFTYDKESKSIVPNYIGKVDILRGVATKVSANGKSASLKKDMKIYKQDRVSTSKASVLKIKMVDNTTVTLGPKSEMNFEKFVYRTKKDRDSVISLMKGKMRVHYNIKAPKRDSLKVKVKHVSMGVRGTKILANTKKIKDYHLSQILLIEGEGFVQDTHHDHEFIIKPKDHYVSSSYKEKKYQKKLIKIKGDEHDYYKGKTASSTDLLPLMPFQKIKDHQGNVLSDESELDSEDDSSSESLDYLEQPPKPDWKKTLKKLNNRLKSE
ncbi:MAG: FecR domain-containing protein [Oligoflexia bacterium]|nr:FecR domain-containing protein [Oligoflexia bacterium]